MKLATIDAFLVVMGCFIVGWRHVNYGYPIQCQMVHHAYTYRILERHGAYAAREPIECRYSKYTARVRHNGDKGLARLVHELPCRRVHHRYASGTPEWYACRRHAEFVYQACQTRTSIVMYACRTLRILVFDRSAYRSRTMAFQYVVRVPIVYRSTWGTHTSQWRYGLGMLGIRTPRDGGTRTIQVCRWRTNGVPFDVGVCTAYWNGMVRMRYASRSNVIILSIRHVYLTMGVRDWYAWYTNAAWRQHVYHRSVPLAYWWCIIRHGSPALEMT